MFVEQLRCTIEASLRIELARVAQLLWRAYGAGHITEAEAAALSEAIEARRALPPPQKPAQRRLGSRPRNHLPAWSAAAAGPPPGLCRRSSPAGSPWPSKRSWL